jgi:hypothetical protein
MHQIAFCAESQFIGNLKIFDLTDAGRADDVTDLIGAIINNDPLHTIFWISLIAKTVKHGL